jgi:hypothetical protein
MAGLKPYLGAMHRFWFLFFGWMLGGLLASAPLNSHPYYVSVTELHFFEKRAELSVKIFTDDFEKALGSLPGGSKADLIRRLPTGRIDSLVAFYIQQHVKIQLNEQPLAFTYLGYEIKEDATWAHFEATFGVKPKRVRIENTLLFDYFPNQQNIVHLAQGDYKRSRRLSSGNAVMESNELR